MGEGALMRWEVKVVRESLEEATTYVSAATRDGADEMAKLEMAEGRMPPLDTSWSETRLEIEQIDATHPPDPILPAPDLGVICRRCLKSVIWTGTAADDPRNETRRPIPGPWLHVGWQV
jgi:hypothetical protein